VKVEIHDDGGSGGKITVSGKGSGLLSGKALGDLDMLDARGWGAAARGPFRRPRRDGKADMSRGCKKGKRGEAHDGA
jgi:hypothetical protein